MTEILFSQTGLSVLLALVIGLTLLNQHIRYGWLLSAVLINGWVAIAFLQGIEPELILCGVLGSALAAFRPGQGGRP